MRRQCEELFPSNVYTLKKYECVRTVMGRIFFQIAPKNHICDVLSENKITPHASNAQCGAASENAKNMRRSFGIFANAINIFACHVDLGGVGYSLPFDLFFPCQKGVHRVKKGGFQPKMPRPQAPATPFLCTRVVGVRTASPKPRFSTFPQSTRKVVGPF